MRVSDSNAPPPPRSLRSAPAIRVYDDDLVRTIFELRSRVQSDPDPGLLAIALDLSRIVVEGESHRPDNQAIALSERSILLRIHGERSGDVAWLREAVETGRQGFDLAERVAGYRGRCASALLCALIDLVQAQPESGALEEMLGLCRYLQAFDDDDEESTLTLSNVANALLLAGKLRGDRTLVDEAAVLHRAVLRTLPPGDPRRWSFAVNLASALLAHFFASRTPSSLVEAREHAMNALAEMPPGHPAGARVTELAGFLSSALAKLGELAHERTDEP
jgi:hypothetical protein